MVKIQDLLKKYKNIIKNSDISVKFLKLKNDTSYYEKLDQILGGIINENL